jgi:GTP pyrophosphokinase
MASFRQIFADFDPHQAKLQEILAVLRTNRPGADSGVVERAYEFVRERHAGQQRASGEPFLIHLLETAHLVAAMRLDAAAVAAALLHDTLEDTPTSLSELSRQFGKPVAQMVEGVTKISMIEVASREERQAETVRKMVRAMTEDIRVAIIKLADRLHNMRTLEHLTAEQQARIACETRDIYVPIAHRLGMGRIRRELEELAFRYAEPAAHEQLRQQIDHQRRGAEEFFSAKIEPVIANKLREAGVEARVMLRAKRLWTIHQKLEGRYAARHEFGKIFTLRLVCRSVLDCYTTLGIVHSLWTPVPGRFKDFIALPRSNQYQSLHTLVMTGGTSFDAHICTEEMYLAAEEGITAYWKPGEELVSARDDRHVAWLRHLAEWQREVSNARELLATVKTDFFPDEVYTFTPKGKVIVLPRDATPIDFAYTVHSEIGHACAGARVNGRAVPLDFKLRSGDIVEIVTKSGHEPTSAWLSLVKAPRARQAIKHWLNTRQHARAIEIGNKLIEREARKAHIGVAGIPEEDFQRIAAEYGCAGREDLVAGIGYGKYTAAQLLACLPSVRAAPPPPGGGDEGSSFGGLVRRLLGKANVVKFTGEGDPLVRRARCCSPIRGEEIVGYLTLGRGIAVHAKDCPAVLDQVSEADRRISVEWAHRGALPVKIAVTADNVSGILKQIAAAISDEGFNILSIEAHVKNQIAGIEALIEVENLKQLEHLFGELRKIPRVHEAQRAKR